MILVVCVCVECLYCMCAYEAGQLHKSHGYAYHMAAGRISLCVHLKKG